MNAQARNRWLWLAAALLMLAEFLVFDRMTARYHAHVYPRWTDEIQYLTESYNGWQQTQAHGLWAGLKSTLTKPAVQGTVHDFFAVLVFWLVGEPSRSAALSLNMIVLLCWQAALLAVIPRTTGSRALGWAAFGLVLCIAWPWGVDAGSAVDFRLDHGAMCLFGVCATLALGTRGFRSTGWSVALGLVVGLTLLERFLTSVYFVAIFAAALAWIAAGSERWLRLRNLGLAGLIAAALAAPMFWLNRTMIYNYYWIGHMASADADARASTLNLWESMQYVFGNLGQRQLGAWFGWTVAAVTAPLLVAALSSRRKAPSPLDRDGLFFALAFLVLPSAVLCLHRQKSFYVLGILAPGVILLAVWIWGALWRRIDFTGWARRLPLGLAIASVAAGLGYFLVRQLPSPHTAAFSAGATKINEVADHLYATSRRAGLTTPRIGVDLLTDYFDGRTMSVLCYERQRQWLTFSPLLPTGILEVPDALVMERLGQCDFVLLTDFFPENGYYPFDRQMRRLYPEVKAWCDTHLRLVESFPIFNRRMSLYQRRELP
jgi:hypothetical protein